MACTAGCKLYVYLLCLVVSRTLVPLFRGVGVRALRGSNPGGSRQERAETYSPVSLVPACLGRLCPRGIFEAQKHGQPQNNRMLEG